MHIDCAMGVICDSALLAKAGSVDILPPSPFSTSYGNSGFNLLQPLWGLWDLDSCCLILV